MAHLTMAAGFLLILIGLYDALTQRNLMRPIVGFTIADAGTNQAIVALGNMPGRGPGRGLFGNAGVFARRQGGGNGRRRPGAH